MINIADVRMAVSHHPQHTCLVGIALPHQLQRFWETLVEDDKIIKDSTLEIRAATPEEIETEWKDGGFSSQEEWLAKVGDPEYLTT